MKFLSLVLCLFLTGSSLAGQPPVFAPVNVAFELYKGCVQAYAQNEHDLPSTSKDANEWLQEIDHNCIEWTSIWLPTLVPRQLNTREVKFLDERRLSLLQGLYNELADLSTKK